jgi:uncharacterized membrane protein YdjX (TVP38/TMEM64 family)
MPLMDAANTQKGIHRWLKWSVGLAACILMLWFWQPIWAFMRILADRQAVVAYLEQFGFVALLLLIVALMIQVILTPVPGHALIIGCGYVYGFGIGLCINLAATVVASQGAFFLARWAGRPVVERLTPAKTLRKWNDVTAEKGLLFFLLAFMLPIFPADVMNYVAGLSALSGRRFFVANVLGRLPGIALITAVGSYGIHLSGQNMVIISMSSILMVAVWQLEFVRNRIKSLINILTPLEKTTLPD